MDYDVLTTFRDALRAITSATSCDVDTEKVRILQASYSKLDPKTIVHEIEHFDSPIARFRAVRYLPASCRAYILRSGVLSIRTEKGYADIMNGKRSLRHALAAQCSSLARDWGEPGASPLVSDGVRKLRDAYVRVLIDAPEAVDVPIVLGRLTDEGNTILKQLRETVALIGVDESLEVMEEAICAQWAELRNITNSILKHTPQARKFLLDFDLHSAKDFFHACDCTRRVIVNRDIELPDLRAPLGAGNARRLLPFTQPSNQPGNQADDDSDEWEDPVELSADELDVSNAPMSVVTNINVPTQSKITSPVSLPSSVVTSVVVDDIQVNENPKSSSIKPGPTLGRRGKAANHHNNVILEALEATSQQRDNSFGNSSKKRGKKVGESSVRDRLRTKLGIMKKRRS